MSGRCQINVSANSGLVGKNEVFELEIQHPKSYANNWEDVKVEVSFTGSRVITIGGFYFDQFLWKARFAPPSVGRWAYTLKFICPDGTFISSGNFDCVASDTKGFLKQHPNNAFRLIYDDGTLFNGVGFEDCMQDFNGNGSSLDDFGFDGEKISGTYTGVLTDLNTYMSAYGKDGARFNLFRWTTDNCSFKLYDFISNAGNNYLIKEGLAGDTLVKKLRSENIRVWLTFFGTPIFNELNSSMPQEEAAIKRYIDYVMARYGAYVDIWELFNESFASSYYYQTICNYIKQKDPYKRLISVSDERPAIDVIDINSPHWYERESELESDKRAFEMISQRKIYKKPIIFGEQGNSVQNWDELSAERMRLRTWTSFFAEGILIFWNTSYSKSYMHPKSANIYLGPLERSYIRALQDYSATADSSVVPVQLSLLNGSDVRSYALGGKNTLHAYFHHFTSHSSGVIASFKIRMKKPATVYWINPKDNSTITVSRAPYGTQMINSPSFTIDIAMRVVYDTGNTVFDEMERMDVLVYPNPAAKQISINGNFNGRATLELFDLSGKKVFAQKNVANDSPVNIPGLSGGVYIYRITADKRRAEGKLLIVH